MQVVTHKLLSVLSQEQKESAGALRSKQSMMRHQVLRQNLMTSKNSFMSRTSPPVLSVDLSAATSTMNDLCYQASGLKLEHITELSFDRCGIDAWLDHFKNGISTMEDGEAFLDYCL